DAGSLQKTATRKGSRQFTVDYELGPPDAFAFWVASQHGRGLSFTSEALDARHELVGFPVMHLRIAADQPEPLLFAYLEALSAEKVEVLAFGRHAAAYRKTGKPP